jgi:hypothetical protein
VAAHWTLVKRVLYYGLLLQSVGTSAIAVFAGVSLFPGALTPTTRDTVMHRFARGYSAAQWLDRSLPPAAVVLGNGWSHVLMPRRYISADTLRFSDSENDVARLAVLARSYGADTLFIEGDSLKFEQFGLQCGSQMWPAKVFTEATRNPFNRQTYTVKVFRIETCR